MSADVPKIITAGELAERLGGGVLGDAGVKLRGVAVLQEAAADELSWAQSEKYARQAAESKAAALLTPRDMGRIGEKTCIVVQDVEWAMLGALQAFAPPAVTLPEGVHPTAVVHASAQVAGAAIGPAVCIGPRARIGRGAQLHAGVHVGEDSTIGADCVLWPNVVVRERITIGDRVIIHSNANIGADGFGYIFREGRHRKVPQIGTVIIEDDVEIGAGACIDRAKCGATRIGRGVKIDNLVQVAHNVLIGPDCILVAQAGVSGSCILGRGVVLAGQVGLADHLRIGDGTVVGAQAGVSRDLPPGQIVRGTPAAPLRQQLRWEALTRRLPDMVEELRELRNRIERLESSADH